jgi:predicted glutamine amidotransferase
MLPAEVTSPRVKQSGKGKISNMCIIAIKPKNKAMFTENQLRTMFANNPDGCGYMYVYDEAVVIRKGFMTAEDLIKDLNENGQLGDAFSKNIVFHFRIGTSGYFDKLNCHPFPIYDANATYCRTDIALVHNGILRDFEPPRNSDINDTQVFIQTVLRKLKKGFQCDKDKMMLIGHIIGANKLAFMDDLGRVTMVGDFIKDNGYIYSNESYKPRARKTAKKKWKYEWLWNEPEEDDLWKELDKKYAI